MNDQFLFNLFYIAKETYTRKDYLLLHHSHHHHPLHLTWASLHRGRWPEAAGLILLLHQQGHHLHLQLPRSYSTGTAKIKQHINYCHFQHMPPIYHTVPSEVFSHFIMLTFNTTVKCLAIAMNTAVFQGARHRRQPLFYGDFHHKDTSQHIDWLGFWKYTHWGWSLRFPIIILIKPFNIYVRVFLAQPTSPLAHLNGEHK